MNTSKIYNPLLRNVFSEVTFRLVSLSLGKHRQVGVSGLTAPQAITSLPLQPTYEMNQKCADLDHMIWAADPDAEPARYIWAPRAGQ